MHRGQCGPRSTLLHAPVTRYPPPPLSQNEVPPFFPRVPACLSRSHPVLASDMKGLHPPLEEPVGKGRTLGQVPAKHLIQLYKTSIAVAGVRVEGSIVNYGTPVSTQVQAATKFQKLFHTGEVITDAKTREAVH